MSDRIQDYSAILEAREKLHKLQIEHWRQHELFTYQWWALLALHLSKVKACIKQKPSC